MICAERCRFINLVLGWEGRFFGENNILGGLSIKV